jgi:hypothetical protein
VFALATLQEAQIFIGSPLYVETGVRFSFRITLRFLSFFFAPP